MSVLGYNKSSGKSRRVAFLRELADTGFSMAGEAYTPMMTWRGAPFKKEFITTIKKLVSIAPGASTLPGKKWQKWRRPQTER